MSTKEALERMDRLQTRLGMDLVDTLEYAKHNLSELSPLDRQAFVIVFDGFRRLFNGVQRDV